MCFFHFSGEGNAFFLFVVQFGKIEFPYFKVYPITCMALVGWRLRKDKFDSNYICSLSRLPRSWKLHPFRKRGLPPPKVFHEGDIPCRVFLPKSWQRNGLESFMIWAKNFTPSKAIGHTSLWKASCSADRLFLHFQVSGTALGARPDRVHRIRRIRGIRRKVCFFGRRKSNHFRQKMFIIFI